MTSQMLSKWVLFMFAAFPTWLSWTPEWRFTWFPKSSHILPVLLRFFVGTLWETYGNGFPSFEFESLEFPPLLCKYVHSARPFQVPNLVPKPFPKHLPSMYQPGPCLGWAPSSIPSWLKSLEASGSLAAAVHWQKVSHFRLGNGSSTSHVKGLFDLSRSHHVCEDVQWGKAGWPLAQSMFHPMCQSTTTAAPLADYLFLSRRFRFHEIVT